MAGDTRTLTLAIHAEIEAARQQLGALVGVLGTTATQVDGKLSAIEAKFASVSQGISTGKAALLGAAAGFAGGIVAQLPGALIVAAKNAVDYASSLGEVSQQLGVGTGFLQDYRFAVTQTGATIEQGDLALKNFTNTTGKAAEGNKRALAAFKAAGVEIGDSNGKLKPTEQLYRDVADAISKIEDPARRARIATGLFGESAYKILPLLKTGSAGLTEFGDAARALGLNLSDETIAKLDGLADKASAIKQVITLQLAAAIGENADAILALGNAGVQAVGGLSAFLTQMRGVKAMIADHGLLGYIASGATQEEELRYGTRDGRKADLEAGVRATQQKLRAKQRGEGPLIGPTEEALKIDLANRRKLLADYLNSPEYKAGVRAGVVPDATGGGGDITAPPEKAPKAAKVAKPAAAKATLAEMIADMPKVGLAFDDASAGVDKLFSKLDGTGKTIEDIVSDTLSLGDALETLKLPDFIDAEQEQRIQDFGKSLSQNVGQALIYGQKLGPALVNSLKAAAAEAVTSGIFKLLTSGGSGGGLLGAITSGIGSLFGGGFASGGDPPVGKWSLVGERGPELIKPRGAMTVVPNHLLGGGGGGITVNQSLAVNLSGNAATKEDAAMFAAVARDQAISAFRQVFNSGIPVT